MKETIRLAIIGTDSSHSVAFAQLLQDEKHPYHVPGARVIAAYPGGSPDFELSRSRVDGFAKRLREEFGVRLAATPEEAAEGADGVLLLAADGRQHLELFRRVAEPGRPVFIDKPLATTYREAKEVAERAEQLSMPFMTGSSLRYAEDLVTALAAAEGSNNEGSDVVHGADCFGPIAMEPTQGGYLWYGIHAAEMLYAAMGTGCERVTAVSSPGGEHLVGVWPGGRVGTVRGSREGSEFAAVLHLGAKSVYVPIKPESKPYYASLLERVIGLFRDGRADRLPTTDESLEIIRFLEAANRSRESGREVLLHEIE